MKNRQSGFTIVELLVVIVVIGILASITIVAYSGVTERANQNAAQANATAISRAAATVLANTGSVPVTNATSSTVLTNLNASDAKVSLPSGSTVSSATSTSYTTFSYRTKGTTGYCVGYWDGTTPPSYIFGGDATADNGTTCS